jgi:hypothetical protein
VRHAAKADRRPLLAFLLVILAGGAVLAWTYGRPAADAAPAGPPSSVGAAPNGPVQAAGTFPADGPIVPVQLSIPAIDVDAVVESRGTVRYANAFTGEPVSGFGVPESMETTSWWSDGPQPGSGQMAVVLGHQNDAGSAVFNRLLELRPGDRMTLADVDGATLTLEVLGEPLTGLDKATSALSDALNGHPAEADLALVTCGGEYDPEARASEDNTVVFASIVPA